MKIKYQILTFIILFSGSMNAQVLYGLEELENKTGNILIFSWIALINVFILLFFKYIKKPISKKILVFSFLTSCATVIVLWNIEFTKSFLLLPAMILMELLF